VVVRLGQSVEAERTRKWRRARTGKWCAGGFGGGGLTDTIGEGE